MIGAEFFLKKFNYPDGSTLKMHIWNIDCREKFRALPPLFIKDSHAGLIVYAIDD